MFVKNEIRHPAVAGMFYPADAEALRREAESYLNAAEAIPQPARIFGLIAPHAGYMYSGAVAARAYKQLQGKTFGTVVVVSPSHRAYFREVSIFPGKYYQTPLGEIEVDTTRARLLAQSEENLLLREDGHRQAEHALEVQLPFLQLVLPKFKLIPIVMGDQGSANIEALADALTKICDDENILLVASSDLSHFHDGKTANELDGRVVEEISAFNISGLQELLSMGKSEMCGGGPVLSVMQACRNMGADKSRVLQYKTSGDVTGDHSQVVGYLSAVLYN